METPRTSQMQGIAANPIGKSLGCGVVEIPLLLSTNRAAALLQLSRDRHQTVAQVLRDLIEHALTTERV